MNVEQGSGTVETVFGVLSYRTGDYVLLPRATTHRWLPDSTAGPSRLYAFEASSHIAPPKRYLTRYGQLLEHAPYCERDLHGPATPFLGWTAPTSTCWSSTAAVVPLSQGGLVGSRMTYATHPFDVVGWDGCLYPYTFNVEDFMPITGKLHQPPPVHQVFEGQKLRDLQLSHLQPSKVDYHPESIPVPYYHSNVRLRRGDVLRRRRLRGPQGLRINIGSVSLPPGRLCARAAALAVEASIGAEFLRRARVMVDTFRPLELVRRRSPRRTRPTPGPGPAVARTPTPPPTPAPPSSATPDADRHSCSGFNGVSWQR